MKFKRILAAAMAGLMVVTSAPAAGLGSLVAYAEGENTFTALTDTTGWVASADSEYPDEPAGNALVSDGKWHSDWTNGSANKPVSTSTMVGNNHIFLTLPEDQGTVSKVVYTPRAVVNDAGGGALNGNIRKASIYVATAADASADQWKKVVSEQACEYSEENINAEFSFTAESDVKLVIIEVLEADGGNQFITGKKVQVYNGDTEITGLTATADADAHDGSEVTNLVDSDDTNQFHTPWPGDDSALKRPVSVSEMTGKNNYYLTLPEAKTLGKLTYVSAQQNGAIKNANVYVSNDTLTEGQTAKDITNWEKVYDGTQTAWTYDEGWEASHDAVFSEAKTAKHVKIEAKHTYGDSASDSFISAKQFILYEAAQESPADTELAQAQAELQTAIDAAMVIYQADPENRNGVYTDDSWFDFVQALTGAYALVNSSNIEFVRDGLNVLTTAQQGLTLAQQPVEVPELSVTVPVAGQKPAAAQAIESEGALNYEVTSTTWKDEQDQPVEGDATFAQHMDYTMTTVLTAKAGYVFADSSKPTVLHAGDLEIPVTDVVISADRVTMTITCTFTGEKTEEELKAEAIAALESAVAASQETYTAGNDNNIWTPETWQAFAQAYDAATAINKETAAVGDINTAAANLTNAKNALQPVIVDTKINGLGVTVTAPVGGKKPVNPSVEPAETGTHYTDIADRAADPATLTLRAGKTNEVVFDEVWGYTGQLAANNADANNDKFDVYGAENPMIIRFKMKSDKTDISGSGSGDNEKTVQLLGKMDEQYGVQINSSKVQVYIHGNGNDWPQSEYVINDSFWNKWHEIMVVFTGTKMQIYVDGKPGKASAGRPNAEDNYNVTLRQFTGSVFTTGYNAQKTDKETEYVPYEGKLTDIELFRGTDYTAGLTKSYQEVTSALDAAVPAFDLSFKPYRSSTEWYKGDEKIAADTTFETGSVYKSVTTLTARDGYRFPDQVTIQGADTEVTNAGKTLKLTITYPVATAPDCSCTIDSITFNNDSISMGIADSKDYNLNATAVVGGECDIENHGTASYSYKVTDGSSIASIAGNVLTVRGVGTVKVEVTVTAGDASSTKEATFTVTSDKATAEDKAPLKALIEECSNLKEADHTADTWKALQDKLKAANDAYEKTNASKNEVSTAKTNLESARNALKTKLDAAREVYDTIELPVQDDAEKYTADSWNMLVAAQEAYNAEAQKTEPDGAKLLELAEALKAAADGLKPAEPKDPAELTAAKAEVSKALAAAKTLFDAGQKDYTDATWKAFADAYKAAQNPAANADAAALKALAAALAKAQAGLTKAAAPVAPVAPVEPGKVYDSGNYSYKVLSVTDLTAEVTALKNPSLTSIKIYNTVTLGGKSFKITSVAPSVFKNNKKIKSVVIGKNVTKIGKDAFSGCTGLKKLTLGVNVKTIDKNSFSNCKKLSSIVVKGKAIKTIKSGAFKKTAVKMTVKMPKKLDKKQRTVLMKKFTKAGVTKKAKMK